ncbi:MAG: PRC-barrel domain-containing protein [Candidatus Thermoplasmatota archaeon]|nr:PRC-barrel domain-containing protein [Candidatus Thermoplasmatota archaeon]
MLAKIIEDYKVVNSVGNNVGKIKDIYIDLDTWLINSLEISPGTMKKDILIDVDDIVKFDETDKIIIVKDEFESKEIPTHPMKGNYPFEELRKHHVVDSEGEKIGKVYNLEIPFEKLKTFKVWKVLIKTGFKDRRLRINTSEITEVMDDIKLARKNEYYTGEEE